MGRPVPRGLPGLGRSEPLASVCSASRKAVCPSCTHSQQPLLPGKQGAARGLSKVRSLSFLGFRVCHRRRHLPRAGADPDRDTSPHQGPHQGFDSGADCLSRNPLQCLASLVNGRESTGPRPSSAVCPPRHWATQTASAAHLVLRARRGARLFVVSLPLQVSLGK